MTDTSLWNGYKFERFSFEDRDAIIVFPKERLEDGAWALKTEYWGAYPDIELKLLGRGFHLAYVKNKTRFATREDCDVKARFVEYISKKYSLSPKCVPVGMSCGGAHAVNFAGYYPHLISCLYIDAPVLNFCDFPAKPSWSGIWEKEFTVAYPGVKRSDLLFFEPHPLNRAKALIENRIPVLLVYGDEDRTVIYEENGKLLEEAFADSDLLKVIRVSCRGHHPHGMIDTNDNERIVDYIVDKTTAQKNG